MRIVVALAVLSTLVRVWLAHTHYGFQTGDDVEIAEEAFRRAVGLAHAPWNVRNLFIPDVLVAPFVWVAHTIGVRDSLALATVARYPFILLSAVNIVLLFVLGRRWCGETAALVASALYAAHWMPLVYGSSLYPRAVAVTCVLGAAILLRRRPAVAGLLAALAVTARYSEAVFLVPLLWLAWQGDDGTNRTNRTNGTYGTAAPGWSRWAPLLGGFAVGILLFVGLYDRLTWGQWFGSLLHFAELTFIRRDASSAVAVQPPWWYLTNLPHWLPLTLLPGLVRSDRRRAVVLVLLPLLALSAIFHKELRYLQVLVPFALLLGVHGLLTWQRRRLAIVLLVLALPLGLTRIGQAAKRTTNAVTAARWMATQRPSTVLVSQAWAYGGRLFLGNAAAIHDIGIPPDVTRIQTSTSMVAAYAADANESLRRACTEAGLTRMTEFRNRGGRQVLVCSR